MNKQIDNGIKLFEYLEKLSLLNVNIKKNIKNLSKEEELFDLENKDFLPVLDKIFLKNREPKNEKNNDDVLLSIERYKIEKPPKLPSKLEKWIDFELINFIKPEPKEFIVLEEKFEDSKERKIAFEELISDSDNSKQTLFGEIDSISNNLNPILKNWVTKNDIGKYEKIEERSKKSFFKKLPELVSLYNDWIDLKWEKWRERNYQYSVSNQAYDKFYSLRSFLKTESDSYDLLWGHDILAWKQEGEEIYHPTFFTPVIVEFDSDRNIIYIKSDTNLKTFFDVAFVREARKNENANSLDIDLLAERVNKKINDNDLDIWDYELIQKYSQQLAHYISPDGESRYNDRDSNVEITAHPIDFNSHNLFLLKKSGKSWADYAKRIQEDIKNNGTLTPFLKDLVCDDNKEESEEEADETCVDNNLSDKAIDGELYFPLPYNEEQKRIANQIDLTYGSVVQGPPGTGKTHTIANLISRFLALGKTVLVTSQTGQALSVLKDKIPKEIRSMVVSQVEASSRNNDLQSSVSEINAMLSDTTKFTEERKERIQKDLQNIREQVSRKNNEFERKSLLDSREEIVIGTEKFTPITAAKFIMEFQNNSEFKILDDVNYVDELVFSQNKIDGYVSLLKSTESEVWDFVKLDRIPMVNTLPKIDTLKRFFELSKNLNKEDILLSTRYVPTEEDLKSIDNIDKHIREYDKHKEKASELKKRLREVDFFAKLNVSESDFFDIKKKDDILKICDSLEKTRQVLNSFDESYEKELFEVIKNENQKKWWRLIIVKIRKQLEEYRESDRKLLGKKIEFIDNYEVEYIKAIEIISKISKKAEANNNKVSKGIGLFLNLDIKKFIQKTRIDGKKIDDTYDIDIVSAYFLKMELEESLKNIWEQAFQNMRNKKELVDPFNIVELEGLYNCIMNIVYFEESNIKLKYDLESSMLFKDVVVTDLSFIQKAIDVFDGFVSVFKVNEYSDFIKGIANEFRKDNSHEKTFLLSKYIEEKNLEKIISLKEEIKELSKCKELSREYADLKKEIFGDVVQKLRANKHNHKNVIAYLQNLETGELEEIKSFYKQVPDLIDKQNKSEEIRLIEDVLRVKMPKTVEEIKLIIKKEGEIILNIENNWKWRRLISWLDELHLGDSISKISKELRILKNQEMDLVKSLVEVSAWIHLKGRVTKRQKEALASFALSMTKGGKFLGKYASKHLNDAKNSLKIGSSAVPVWIMPVNRIHQLFPDPKAGMFDVVIFDEASQVDTRGLNIAYVGKKLLVVGDEKQVSPTSFTNQNKVTDLITRYISAVPNSQHFSNTSSLFDIAKIKMTDTITLTEHFRSIEEIIGFSNALSYDGKLKVLRDQLPKYRLEPVLEAVFVEDGFEETNAKVNKPEAKAIVEKLKEMLQDDKYKETGEEGKTQPITFGIISILGKDQQKYITKLISEEIPSKEIEKRKIVCGDPYVFQGDERDIIFISMVKAPDFQNPEKTIMALGDGDKKMNKQRINVAMSRAKNKMILFHSIPKDKLANPNDLRKRILDWFYNHKTEEKRSGLQTIREEVERGRASEFEYDVAEIIINKGYKVIPQYEAAGYRIDFVIQGENARLAVECDGDKYHNQIDKWQEDIERQQILERSGWNFWRIAGSAFYSHGHSSLDSLWEKLDEMGISPRI